MVWPRPRRRGRGRGRASGRDHPTAQRYWPRGGGRRPAGGYRPREGGVGAPCWGGLSCLGPLAERRPGAGVTARPPALQRLTVFVAPGLGGGCRGSAPRAAPGDGPGLLPAALSWGKQNLAAGKPWLGHGALGSLAGEKLSVGEYLSVGPDSLASSRGAVPPRPAPVTRCQCPARALLRLCRAGSWLPSRAVAAGGFPSSSTWPRPTGRAQTQEPLTLAWCGRCAVRTDQASPGWAVVPRGRPVPPCKLILDN